MQNQQFDQNNNRAPMTGSEAPVGAPVGGEHKGGGLMSSSHEHSQHQQPMGGQQAFGSQQSMGGQQGFGGQQSMGGQQPLGGAGHHDQHDHSTGHSHGGHQDHSLGGKAKEVFGAFDATKDHTSTSQVDKGIPGHNDVAREDGVNAPDVHDKSRLPQHDASSHHDSSMGHHGTAPVNKTGVESQSTSAPGGQHGHPEAGLAHGDTGGSRGATGAGLAGGDRTLDRTHESHNVHDHHNNDRHDGHKDGEHKQGIVEKIKEKLHH